MNEDDFLIKYDGFYDNRNDAILFERILKIDNHEVKSRANNGSDDEKRAYEKLLQWLPRDLENVGDHYIRVYHEYGNAFRQKAYGLSWDTNLKKIIELLIMKPDENKPHELVNINNEAGQVLDDEFEWRITEWRTRVTKSIEEPFEPTNNFPMKEAGNLLCDYITWKNKFHSEEDKGIVTSYGWNAYKN